ncbi:hypothetical protein FRAHR75_1260019 [Frankia sp. Hr75.2]|nr:hypothetical protein FRAHR75_1260019 [Frankia sp. Hr75.2]
MIDAQTRRASTSCPTAALTRWRHGCAPTPASRSSAGTAPAPRIMRQMHGRAGFTLLRHCILLDQHPVTTESEPEPAIGHSRTRLLNA